MIRREIKLASVAGRAGVVAALLCAAANAPLARAQTIVRPFSHTLFYTVAGDGVVPPVMKSVTISGRDVLSATATDLTLVSVFAPDFRGGPGIGDLVFAPDGDILVAGAANKIYKVSLPNGDNFSVRASITTGGFNSAPTVLSLASDPSVDRAWALGAESLASEIGLLPGPDSNPPRAITGAEASTRLFSLVWAPGAVGASGAQGHGPRVLYTAVQTAADGSEEHHLGRIDMDTLTTTRLVASLPSARAMVLDAFTGKLILFGGSTIAQMDPDPATPLVEDTFDVSSIPGGQNIVLVDGTADAEGRLFALSADGRLVVVDYAQSRSVSNGINKVKIINLESSIGTPGTTVGPNTPGAVQAMAPLTGPGRAQLAYCVWDNGDFDGLNGQASSIDLYSGSPMTADDFYLEPASVYRIDTITGLLATNSLQPKARLTLFDDCDGVPGNQLATYDSLRMVDTGRLSGGLHVYRAEFALGGLYVATDASAGGGRTFWVSVQGVALGQPDEEWYWGTSGNAHPKGSPARFRSASLGYPDWTSVDGLGCGCTDFAFGVIGERCKLLYDGGGLDLTAQPAGSLSQIASVSDSARSADNFVLPPCAPADRIESVRETVCYLRAYIWSNCDPVRGRFEIYDNTCKSPADPETPISPPTPLYSTPFARITDLGFTTIIDGESVSAFCVESTGLDWNLPSGHDYWLSAVGDTNLAWRKRFYFAFAERCDRACPVMFSPAVVVGQGAGASTWQKISLNGQQRDLAFMVAAQQPAPPNGLGAGGIGSRPPCEADVDGSGTVSLQDVFEFLTRWFAGCP